ncbi:Na/Pi cotransporter family protein [Herbivorax sp. ANBcel31]|uniref:Na/Pi cotransporter family protein n=1 Tax=Herbivorax sp. ANBcel31 TaxID=3069754 RepID=UPI0027B64085|nr:Na/Pi cotransporter family protein [Herbivorax sp. ANBcel31]MDQ2086318.1 Na/Pi cotransporter family protein [Herbivorax sp. ANBcel31]
MTGNLEISNMIFGLLGGLAIFIYGMNLMGDGLQKAAGERMRRILEVLTNNPFIGILVGALVTLMLQSSTATTVMVIGFVSAKLMTLPQAVGVIMGANIGTTITAQLIAFRVGSYAYLIAAIGFVLFFFFHKKIIKYIGQTIFAFGLLFIGLNIMSDVMRPLSQSAMFENIIQQISSVPVLGLVIGALLTLIVQSSSATIAVLLNLSQQQGADGQALVSLHAALPILFGSNIGTTITAMLASIGARINAKRAAMAHSIFNITGAIIFMMFIPLFARFVVFISPKGIETEIITRQIANAHTSFNIINTLIWLPFIFLLTKIVTFFIKGEEDTLEKRVLYLDYKFLNSASIAMDFATKELTRMAEFAQEMVNDSKKAFIESDATCAKKVHEVEDIVDILQYEIVKYLSTMLSQSSLTERQSIRLAGLMHITNDIERMGDHCKNIAEFAMEKKEKNLPFSEEAINDITETFNKLNDMVKHSIKSLGQDDTSLAKEVLSEESEIDNIEVTLRDRHVKRLESGLCNPTSTIIFVELIHNLERIADHCNNIAEAVLHDLEDYESCNKCLNNNTKTS